MKNFQTNPLSSSTGKAHSRSLVLCCVCTYLDNAIQYLRYLGKSYSTLFVIVMAKRRSNWFLWNVFVPTAACLLISWFTYDYAADARGDRMDVSMATLLASISNK